ncbi:putative polyketide synthase [Daldinia sp. FL1419]|nr:putative polyketide synthase [Daldinia sp. FL1419]
MDPQQRKLLEVVFECFESAGVTPEELSGQNVGCYVGNFALDYSIMQHADIEQINRYTAIGSTPTLLANRISHVFDLKGPSFVADTGCSSSLYSLHSACVALDVRECNAAVVAGANLIQLPQQQALANKTGIISNSATCRTFDASADGYGRAEGVGALFLKRLKDAIRDGDPIRGVIRGTATNSNGRTPGVMQPSSEGQEKVMRQAYARAGLSVHDTDYVEAHGTGTAVGDPIEVDAISRVFSRDVRRPVLIGSVKTNLGHSEAASGLTSVIKVILAMENRIIPPTINLKALNPKISNSNFNVEIVREAIPWPETLSPRASVNSFGFGGANSHAIIEAYPGPHALRRDCESTRGSYSNNTGPSKNVFLIPISAHSAFSLSRRVEDLRKLRLSSMGSKLGPIAYTMANRRARLQYRSYMLAGLAHESNQLDIKHCSQPMHAAASPALPLGFVFTGQGAQWANMGHELFKTYKIFRQSIERQDAYLAPYREGTSWALVQMLSADVNVNQPSISQVFCTAIQVAIIDLLTDWSIRPRAVIGHSSGEIAAAYAAGYVSCREAILLAYFRGVAVSSRNKEVGVTPGAMLAVGIDQYQASDYIEQLDLVDRVSLACVNSPRNVTISGDREAVQTFKEKMDSLSLFNRHVRTECIAYHSHHMRDHVGERYESMIERQLDLDSEYKTPNDGDTSIPMWSTVTGCLLSREQARRARYWRDNLENTVLFDKSLKALLASQDSYIVEIGPHPVLQVAIDEIRTDVYGKYSGQLDSTLHACTLVRKKDGVRCMLDLAGTLFNHGYEPRFDAINRLEPWEKYVITSLPKYPWNYGNNLPWKEPRASVEHRNRRYSRHELLGWQTTGGSGLTLVWRNIISVKDVPWLSDHRFRSTILFPAAGFISMAIEAVCQAEQTSSSENPNIFLRQLKLFKTLPLPGDGSPIEIFTELRRLPLSEIVDSKEWWQFNIESVIDGLHVAHVAGRIACRGSTISLNNQVAQRRLRFDEDTMEYSDVRQWYRRFAEVGINAGPAFEVIREVYMDRMKQKAQVHSKIQLDRGGPNFGVGGYEYVVHPTVIDGMLQTGLLASVASHIAKVRCLVPISIEEIDIITSSVAALDNNNYDGRDLLSIRTSATEAGFAAMVANSELHSPKGDVIVRISKVRNTLYQGVNNAKSAEPRVPSLRVCWKPDMTFLSTEQEGQLLDSLRPSRENRICNAYEADHIQLAECLDLIVHKKPNGKIALLNLDQQTVQQCISVLKPNHHLRRFGQTHLGRLTENTVVCIGSLPEDASSNHNNQQLILQDYDIIVADCSGVLPLLEILRTSTSPETELAITLPVGSISTLQVWERPILHFGMESASLSSNITSIIKGRARRPVASGNTYIVGLDPESALNSAIYKRFKQEPGISVYFLHFSQVSDTSIPSGSNVVLSIEGEGQPVLSRIGAEELRRLQTLTNYASRLIWITRGNLLRAERPENALAWGAARAIGMEEPQLRLVTFDFDDASNITSTASHIFAAFQNTFSSDPQDLEYIEHKGVVHVSRWVPDENLNVIFREKLDLKPSEKCFDGCGPVELSIKVPGQLDTLSFGRQQNPFRDPVGDEVEVEAKCYGMNAKDLYLLRDQLEVPSTSCSLEFSGVVRRIGPGTKSLKVGDRVAVIAPGRYRNFDIVPEWTCVKLLPTEDFQSASTLLLCFTTAVYALKHLARLRSGESVLIHSATGGVGQAAIQLARKAGATIFATAGNQEKRDWLSRKFSIPSTHIFSSRDSSFLSGVLDATNQRGVDIIINSLTGDLLHAGLKALAPLGRFIEIGKKDIFENGRIDLLSMSRSGSFMVLDLLDLVVGGRQWGKDTWISLLEEVMQLYRDRSIESIHPRTVFDVSEITRAFRLFSQQSRMGKVAVSMENPDTKIQLLPKQYDTVFDSRKTYIMIGGFGGIGSSIARWMLSQGARRFVFLSRSGASNPSAANLVADIKSRQGIARIITGDVSNLSDVQRAFHIAPSKIGGVVNASMTVRATHWRSLTCEDWHYSIASKVQGTQNLHQTLAEADGRDGEHPSLDFLLLLSSLSGTIGSPTEPGYCAANAYMDSFARLRRAQGLKATSIGLGVIADVGYLHEHPSMEAVYTRRGLQSIGEDELLQLVDLAISHSDDSTKAEYDTLTQSHLLTGLEMQTAKTRTADPSNTAFDILFQDPRSGLLKASWERDMGSASTAASLSRTELPQVILAAVANGETVEDATNKALSVKIANMIMLPPEQLRVDQPLAGLGLDSMLASEFRTFVFQSMQVDLPFEDLLSKQATIASISTLVVEQLQKKSLDGTGVESP